MRARIAYRAQHGRTPAPSCAPSRLQSRLEGPKGRPPAGHLNATSSSCWPRRDPQLLRNRRGRPVLACSQRSSHPAARDPGHLGRRQLALPPQRWKGEPGRTPAGQMDKMNAQRPRAHGQPPAGRRSARLAGGWLCSLCRKCRQFHFILEIHFPAAFFQAAPAHRTKEIRTKAAGNVRILVRKNRKTLIISVSCGA